MGAVNIDTAVVEICPLAGATNAGLKLGFVDSIGKASQSDTWTLKNVSEIYWIAASLDSSGVFDACTISGNVVTLTGAGTGETSAMVIYRT